MLQNKTYKGDLEIVKRTPKTETVVLETEGLCTLTHINILEPFYQQNITM